VRSWITRPVVAAIVATAVAISGVGTYIASTNHNDGGGGFTCDLNATVASFSSQIRAATASQTVCMTEGSNYGTWTGTNKAITIRPAAGVSPTISLDLGNGDSNFTINGNRDEWDDTTGLTIGPSTFLQNPGPQDITIMDAEVTAAGSGAGGMFEIDGPVDTNILFDHLHFHDINGWEAAVRWSYGPVTSGFTVQDSLFRDMDADGLKVGPAVTALNNKFLRVTPADPEQHTDAIQFNFGRGSVVRGNWVDECEQAIAGFDGTGSAIVEHNLVTNCNLHLISMYGDDPASTVEFNTIAGPDPNAISCPSRSGDPPSLTIIRNNIADEIALVSDVVTCTPTQNTNNLLVTGGTSPNISGSPTFVGGASPRTWTGYALASGSAGENAATDGTDVGIHGEGFTGGPPPDEGF
jgi:hypothetical protein